MGQDPFLHARMKSNFKLETRVCLGYMSIGEPHVYIHEATFPSSSTNSDSTDTLYSNLIGSYILCYTYEHI